MKSYKITDPKSLDKEDNSPDDKKNALDPDLKPIGQQEDIPPISFFKLFRYASGKDKMMMSVGILAAIAVGLTTPLNNIVFGDLADAMIGNAEISDTGELILDNDAFYDAIVSFAMWNGILGVIVLVCSYISVALFNYAALSQIYKIRGSFLKSALNQDIKWYDVNQSGEFASRMNEDLMKLEDGLGEKVSIFITLMVAFVSSITLAFVKGWELALICLCSLPVTMIAVGIVGVVTSRLAKQEMEAYGKAGSIAEEVFSAIRTVVAFGGQYKESHRYKSNLIDARKINIKRGFFSGLGFGLLWFFIYASYALAFWYGVGLVLEERPLPDSETTYTPGVMFVVFFSVMMGSMNLGMASPYIEAFGIAKGAGAKVYKIIEQKPEIDALEAKGDRPDKIMGNILFKNIRFQYPSRPDVKVLEGINLRINHGETVALVGSSGCGKSTCIQLIQRFYDPQDGEILLDDRNIKTLDVNWLRSKIGVVGQEPVLFGTTVYENIRYGRETATREEIEKAAKASNAHKFIQKLPNGYDTLVGERGAQMSGGQKQRIAIARALVRNPEILLLDEATSALDTASEAKVQAALDKASEGRTTIIVAHRLSTIRNADKIIVLSNGQVVEQGNHKELMLLKGTYHGLVTTQVGTDDGESPNKRKDSVYKVMDEDEIELTVATTNKNEDDLVATATPVGLSKIMNLNKPEWRYIVAGSISSIIMGFGMPVFALLFGDVIGVLSSGDDAYVRSQTDIYSLYFVIAGIVIGIATFLSIWAFGVAGEILTERLRGIAFSTMLAQEIGWFDDKQNGTGSLCARLSSDAAAVQGATGQRVGIILQSIATLLLGVGIAMYYEWKLGLVALAFTPLILIAMYKQQKVMQAENLGSTKAMETSTKLAVEVVSSIRTVVSLGKEKMFHDNYMKLLGPSLIVTKKNTHVRGIVYGIARSLMFFAFAATMFYGGYLVINEGLFYADVFKVSQALIMGTASIASALAFAPNFQKGLVAAAKIFQLIERVPKVQDPPVQKNSKFEAHGNVNYNEVEFIYPSRPDTKVLQGLTFDVQQGQTVALVGSSGCGKSTAIQNLIRFYDVTNGSVSIDDCNVKSVTLEQLRKNLGIVSQEPSLFDRTIEENIAYGDNSREPSQAEVIEAARKANIHNFIVSLPLGYDTRLGEKGTQLSGGQKQRIAIARALIRNPRILLLDEATSALDSESEKVVQLALDMAKEGRTCITIAHRLSTIVDSDVIFVMDAGKVVEKGTHKELLDQRGIYYGLYQLQAGRK